MCERCRYYRLDIGGAIQRIEQGRPQTPWENLRRAHVHMKLGNFKAAYDLYRKLASKYLREKKYVSYFLCKYVLAKSNNLIRWNYAHRDQESMLQFIDQINLDEELYVLQKRHNLKEEVLLVLRWINQGNFLNYSYREIDDKLSEIASTYRSDQFGGWTSADHTSPFNYQFAELAGFIEANLLMGETIYGFTEALHKSFEGMLMLYSLNNERNTRLEHFDYYTVRQMLINGHAQKLDALFVKYKIHRIVVKKRQSQTQDSFSFFANNLLTSLNTLSPLLNSQGENPNYYLIEKVNALLKNTCILLSVVEVAPRELNALLSQIITKGIHLIFIKKETLSYFIQIVNRKCKEIDFKTLEKIYVLSFQDEKFRNDQIKYGMPRVLRERSPECVASEELTFAVMEQARSGSHKYADIFYLIPFYEIANSEVRLEISKLVNEKLTASFESNIYYRASIDGVIDYNIYLDVFTSAIPATTRENQVDKMFSRKKKPRDERLNYLVDIAYKYNLDLSGKRFQTLIPDNDNYFTWLFNLDSFDYKNFKPIWILYFQSRNYFHEFKKRPRIVDAIKEALLNKRIEGLSDIYLKYFN